VVDGAQAVAHMPVDFAALGCDFYAFSGHKLYAPDGIGVLIARRERLAAMAPYQVGGGMVRRAERSGSEYATGATRFEAGTPNVSGAVGLAAALDYLQRVDTGVLAAHGQALAALARRRLDELAHVRVLPAAPQGGALLSFVVQGIHAHDIGTVADAHGVALRTGHHCAQPLMQRLRVPATVRASFGIYNDDQDVEALLGALAAARRLLA
jgi:cysteine desulfurase/selenocysteine lyase